jgi:N-acetylmuramoyl-L-alanine amidase
MTNRIISGGLKCFSVFIICLIISLYVFISCADAETGSYGNKKIIVLDPGHGGHDNGATGAEGTYEKTVTLCLAKMIASELENNYRPVLTRTGDYGLDIYDRTDVANNLEAKLFISLHVAGSFLHKANGTTIYYFKTPFDFDENPQGKVSGNNKQDNNQPAWNNIQKRHMTESRAFAEFLQLQIRDRIKQVEAGVNEAPVLVLSGADMPAVLIEIGYISNPDEEKRMNDPEFLSEFAKVISNTIGIFLSEKPDNISCVDN